MSNISKNSKYGKLKLNGIHRDHLPAISHPASVGVKNQI